jgi:hypothetical protein
MVLSKSDLIIRAGLESQFPNLAKTGYSITSPRDNRYNCIAWAIGDATKWWWPVNKYWPGNTPRTTAISAFIMQFSMHGYNEVKSDSLEPGVEKVALYADSFMQVTHAARQLTNGKWTSKMGEQFDIVHALTGLDGGPYGAIGCVLQRILPTQKGP